MRVQIRSTSSELRCESASSGPTGRDELDFDELGHTHAQPESPNLNAHDGCSCAVLLLDHVDHVPTAYGA